jgi:hypothetical protein
MNTIFIFGSGEDADLVDTDAGLFVCRAQRYCGDDCAGRLVRVRADVYGTGTEAIYLRFLHAMGILNDVPVGISVYQVGYRGRHYVLVLVES